MLGMRRLVLQACVGVYVLEVFIIEKWELGNLFIAETFALLLYFYPNDKSVMVDQLYLM